VADTVKVGLVVAWLLILGGMVKVLSAIYSLALLSSEQWVYGDPGPANGKGFVSFAAGVAMALIAEIATNSWKAG
jgi:hypothetical protein